MLSKVIAVLALVASLGAAGISPSLASNKSVVGTPGWDDTNANAAGSRANLAEKVLTPAAVAGVKHLRSITAPPSNPNAYCPGKITAPLLTDGSLYAITATGYLSKYSPRTGKLLWSVKTLPGYSQNFWSYQTLSYSDNLVIVGAYGCRSVSDPGGITAAFNASTGALVWQAAGFGAAVVVGTSYVITEDLDAAGYELSALSLKTGKEIWSWRSCTYSGTPEPVVVGLAVMVYGCDNPQGELLVEALKLATGALMWSLPGRWTLQAGDLAGSAGRHLYATHYAASGSSGIVKDVNPQTGHPEYSLSGAVNVLAVDASRVYATCGSADTDICAYNISAGTLEWQEAPVGPVKLAAEADGVLYLDSGLALNAATGQKIKRLWQFPTRPDAMAVGDGRIVVVSSPRVLDLYGLKGY